MKSESAQGGMKEKKEKMDCFSRSSVTGRLVLDSRENWREGVNLGGVYARRLLGNKELLAGKRGIKDPK